MTAEQFYERALNLCGSKPEYEPKFREYFLGQLNQVLDECFDDENVERRWEHLDILNSAQFVNSYEDMLEYTPKMLDSCVIYGVCRLIAMAEEDYNKANYFALQYEQGKLNFHKAFYMPIEGCCEWQD